MIREIVKIDRDLCDGCGLCIPNCHEGALQIIDNKAVLVSELMCDGLGACLGHCPQESITIEKREAEAYDEVTTVKEIVKHGKNTLIAHLKHLKEHGEIEYLRQAVVYLKSVESTLPFSISEVTKEVHQSQTIQKQEVIMKEEHHHNGGCPGSKSMSFGSKQNEVETEEITSGKSELSQWPIQMHLVNPNASYFASSDLVLAADCVAYSIGNFHSKFLKGKTLGIACPKLDDRKEVYVQKITKLIDEAKINTITVMIMEVPCCSGLLQLVQMAQQNAKRKIPLKAITVGIQGEIQSEEWVLG